MNPISDFLPPAGTFGDAEAEARLDAIRGRLCGNVAAALPSDLAPLAERMSQADEKMRGGGDIARMSELIALAQFGAGSAGRAVAAVLGAPDAAGAAESIYIGSFLADVAGSPDLRNRLLPADLRQSGDISPLLRRATESLSPGGYGRHPLLRRHLRRTAVFARRRVAKLAKYGPDSDRAALTGLDRLFIELRLFLRREHGS